jgi:hypothetical protein
MNTRFGDLAGVQDGRRALAAGDPDLNAPDDQVAVQRVVAGVNANVGIGRHPSAVGSDAS